MKWDGNISFYGTDDLNQTDQFYRNNFNLKLFKDQEKCRIYKIPGGAMLGFCEHMDVLTKNKSPIITFLTDDVDEIYEKLSKVKDIEILSEPVHNKEFSIYQFFLKDPNGYTIEVQNFLN